MTTSKTHTKDIIIPLSLIVVGSLLQAVLPSSENLEKLLLSYLKHKWLLWELRVSTVVLLVLLPYRAYLKHTEKKSSTDIIKSCMDIPEEFLADEHNLIFSKFDEDSNMLRTSLMLKGRFNGSSGMNQFCAQIVSYSNQFLKEVENRATKIHGSNTFLSQQVKCHLERYLEADVVFLKEKLEIVFPARIGSTPMANAKREGESNLRNLYAQFFLNMFE